MKHLYRISLLLALAGGPLLLTTNCSSDKKEDPQPTTGSLAGTITPAGAISIVTAIDGGGLTFLATPDASTGAFSIADLKPGSYLLRFTPTAGYNTPTERNITIVAGEKAAAGIVAVESDGSLRSGTLTWNVNGTTYTSTSVLGGLSEVGGAGNSLSLMATSIVGTTSEQVNIFIGGFGLGLGTYDLGGVYYRSAAYQRTNGGLLVGAYGGQGSSTGTFNITTYDAATKTVTGTFGFTASETNGQGGSVNVTNGTFTLRF
jgi:hypothetical protein